MRQNYPCDHYMHGINVEPEAALINPKQHPMRLDAQLEL